MATRPENRNNRDRARDTNIGGTGLERGQNRQRDRGRSQARDAAAPTRMSASAGRKEGTAAPGRESESRLAGTGSPTPGGALEPLHRIRQDFNRMLDQYFHGWPNPMSLWEAGTGQAWGLDVREDDGAVTIRAEAPGFEPSDFDIEVQGNQLVLRAVHRDESSEQDRGFRQWRRQEFHRSVPIPGGIDPERVDATYRNGILTVRLAKSAQGRHRRIDVKS